MDQFNLLDQPWIPVIYQDGRWTRVGIRDAFTQAGRIRQIAASNPMDRVAILRFLLTILYWCKGNPPTGEKNQLLSASHVLTECLDRLEEHRECFNLLGDGKRFYQNHTYEGKPAEHTTGYLVHEVPSGTNKWHFRHATDFTDGLCPACCAMGLIRLPSFATSAGRGMSPSTGKSPGVNSKPPLYVLPIADSLAATLLLLWRPTDLQLGLPEWQSPDQQLPKKGEMPLLLGLTWLPRSVWLADPEEPTGTCISCGSQSRLIRCCVFDGKGSTKTEHRTWCDPHVIYGATRDGKAISLQTSDPLAASDAAAGRWAEHMATILKSRQSDTGGALWVVGFSTVQNDKYLEATEWVLPLKVTSSAEGELIAALERWHKQVASLARSIERRMPKSSRKHREIRSIVDALCPDIEGRVRRSARLYFGSESNGQNRAALEYVPMMTAAASSLSPGFTTQALQLRTTIASVLPNMTPKERKQGKKGKAS